MARAIPRRNGWLQTAAWVGLGQALLALVLPLTGCQRELRPSPPAAEPVTEVSYRLDSPQREGVHRLRMGESVTGPVGPEDDSPLPDYPQAWVAKGLPPVEVAVLLSIDGQGEARALESSLPDSPVDCSNVCRQAFEQAVRSAVEGWRFQPLQITGWIDGPDEDGDGSADSVRRGVMESRPYSLRLRFEFVVEDGQPQVRHNVAPD